MNDGVTSREKNSLLPRHIPSLDYLRGVAIILVLLFHAYGGVDWEAGLGHVGGGLASALVAECNFGVQLFFLLSGFLITSILLRARARPFYYRDFYVKRALRILPVLIAMLIVLKFYMPISWRFFVASCLFLANFAPLFGAHSSEYGPLWSLCVEEHFYLLWPSCVRHFDPKRLTPLLLAIIVCEPILRVIAIRHNANIDIRFKTPFVLDYIAYGALLSTLIHTGRLHAGNVRRFSVGFLACGIPFVALTLYLRASHESVELIALRPVPWMWLCAGVLLIGLERDGRKQSPAEDRTPGVLGFFAYISYGLYLIAPLVSFKMERPVELYFAPMHLPSATLATIQLVSSGAVAVMIAYLSRRYFEQPFLDLKERFLGRPDSGASSTIPRESAPRL